MAGTSGGYYNSRCSLPSAWETRVTGIRNQSAIQYLKVGGGRGRWTARVCWAPTPEPPTCFLLVWKLSLSILSAQYGLRPGGARRGCWEELGVHNTLGVTDACLAATLTTTASSRTR